MQRNMFVCTCEMDAPSPAPLITDIQQGNFDMTTSIIGLFESSDIASKVLGELTKAGFKKDAVEIIENVAASKITSRLVEAGYEKDKAESYGKAMQKGGALIVAEAPDDKADEALSMMRNFKALPRKPCWRSSANRLPKKPSPPR